MLDNPRRQSPWFRETECPILENESLPKSGEGMSSYFGKEVSERVVKHGVDHWPVYSHALVENWS